MTKYQYKLNEEIIRWAAEVYIRTHPELGWWIAFTNPTAGPWKKLNAPNQRGEFVEVYRFGREEKRPDIVLVNDKLEVVVITEAKYKLSALLDDSQMVKSIQVVNDMKKELAQIDNPVWVKRGEYKTVPSFLWYSNNADSTDGENSSLVSCYSRNNTSLPDNPLNIVLYEDEKGFKNRFYYRGNSYEDLSFSLEE